MSSDDRADDSHRASEAFIQLLTAEQFRLLRYIAMLLGDLHQAQNVLQETNVVLWRKSREYELGTNFSAWSRKVAYWKVQSYLRDAQRERHVFSEELVAQLATRDVTAEQETDARVALRDCISKLSSGHLAMLLDRYANDLPIADLATKYKKTASAIKVQLMRIRRALQRCIERNLAQQMK